MLGPSGLDVIASHADISDCVFTENFWVKKVQR